MRKRTLVDLAPEFKHKNSGWVARYFGGAVVVFLGIALIAEISPLEKAGPALEKTPGIGYLLKEFGVLKPK